MTTTILVICYCIIGFIFHSGVYAEYQKDKSDDLKDFSASFVKLCIVAVSLCWPLMLVTSLIQKIKEKINE